MKFIATIAWLLWTGALGAATLSGPARSGGDFEFAITGASNAVHIIELSTNLQDWATVLTNREITDVRSIRLPANAERGFYRVRRGLSMFTRALVARASVSLEGNNIRVDSFNSADPAASTAGLYDVAKARDHGDVASLSGTTNSLNIGNAHVFGVLHVGPGGIVQAGPDGSVGTAAWINSGQTGIQPGHLVSDMNGEFPDARLPLGAYFTPMAGVVGGVTYSYVLANGAHRLPQLAMSGSQAMYVAGEATLHVAGGISLSGAAKIVIAPGATLALYVGGPSAYFGGNGIVNQAGNAAAFRYYGLPSNTSVRFLGNGTLYATIYAPSADVGLLAGGSSAEDVVGAIVARTISLQGHINFHYDEWLGMTGPVF